MDEARGTGRGQIQKGLQASRSKVVLLQSVDMTKGHFDSTYRVWEILLWTYGLPQPQVVSWNNTY